LKIRQNTKLQQNIIFTTQTRYNKCKLRGLESNNSSLSSYLPHPHLGCVTRSMSTTMKSVTKNGGDAREYRYVNGNCDVREYLQYNLFLHTFTNCYNGHDYDMKLYSS
jgi:hypothetical protein